MFSQTTFKNMRLETCPTIFEAKYGLSNASAEWTKINNKRSGMYQEVFVGISST